MLNKFEKQFKSIINQLDSDINGNDNLIYMENIVKMIGSTNSLMANLNKNIELISNDNDDEFTKLKKAEKTMRIYLLYLKAVETMKEKYDEAKIQYENNMSNVTESEDELILKHLNTDFNDENAYNLMKEELNEDQIELVKLTKLEIQSISDKNIPMKVENNIIENIILNNEEIPIINISNELNNSLNNDILNSKHQDPKQKPKELDIKSQFNNFKKFKLNKNRKRKK